MGVVRSGKAVPRLHDPLPHPSPTRGEGVHCCTRLRFFIAASVVSPCKSRRSIERPCRPHCLKKSRASLAPGFVSGHRGRPVFHSFRFPRMRGVARRARMPWISPGRPGCYRATSRKRPSASLRGDEPAPSQRATRQSRLIAFYGVGPDGAVLRREVKPQVPPESVGSTLPPTAAGCRIPPHHHDAS